ncbi:MED7 protein-domain-containing protein [Circinella umbellata]|nr:MED7 protein-domain-containing protein [Circinella umbellata]
MAEQQATGSAWPDPPYLYKRYTQKNLERLQQAKKTGEFPEIPISQPPEPDFLLASLEPPQPPSDAYTIFDQRWQVHEQLQPLSELGVKQLFPSGQIDRIQELKKLNRTLITQYLDLLDILVKDPEQYGDRIENISTIFINMHHILNEYRPHQARETLRLLMENQIAKKKQLAADLRRKSKETLEMLQKFGVETTKPLLEMDKKDSSDMDIVDIKEEPGETKDVVMEERDKKESEAEQLHQNLISTVDNIV